MHEQLAVRVEAGAGRELAEIGQDQAAGAVFAHAHEVAAQVDADEVAVGVEGEVFGPGEARQRRGLQRQRGPVAVGQVVAAGVGGAAVRRIPVWIISRGDGLWVGPAAGGGEQQREQAEGGVTGRSPGRSCRGCPRGSR
ncbi:MAG: hypothetical protein ACK56F_09325, partial [bacterium]